jgi:Pvc16 N-terminal domain
MSNSLAIATVTAALREMLQPAVSNAVSSATVGFNRPDSGTGTPPSPAVNVYLYQVTPNAAYRGDDLPTRRSDGTVVTRPQAAFDLHYLFTFHGDDSKLEPQLLLGAVASTLHAQPLISSAAIAKAMSDFGTTLSSSNLASQVERIRFTPTSLNLEEFSKLWSVFFQIEYTLSAAYQASVVLLEGDDEPAASVPVQARNISIVPFREPRIDRVVSQAGAEQPIVAGTTLLIQGQQLNGAATLVLIESQEAAPTAVIDTQVTLPLPGGIHAGVKGVQIIQKILIGTPPTPHRGVESNVAPFVLRPTITGAAAAVKAPGITTVTLTVAPNIGVGQRAIVLLNNLAVSPATAITSKPAVASADSNQIGIDIAGVPTGTYLVRIQIDGAESLLKPDLSGPTVAMP